jgi:hypothetical protein
MTGQGIINWIGNHPLHTAIVLVVVPAALGLIITIFPIEPELRKTLYTASLTLIFGGLIGGVLKILLDDFTRSRQKRDNDAILERQKREENAGFIQRVLNDLKSVHDRVGRVRIVIPAHQSALTYGNEMRDLIEARVTLKNVLRALHGPAEGMSETTRQQVVGHIESMETYLETLTTEFADKYKSLSDRQRIYEAQITARLKEQGDLAKHETVFAGDNVWDVLKELPGIKGLMDETDTSLYKVQFEKPLDGASACLREELRKTLSGESVATKAVTATGTRPA